MQALHADTPLGGTADDGGTAPEADGSFHPTWRVSVSPESDPEALAKYLAQRMDPYGFSLTPHFGAWEGVIEPGVTITYQGPDYMFERLLTALAQWGILFGWAHVEKSEPKVMYVNLDARR